MIHHVSLVVTNIERSLAFYRDLFGLTQIERPKFKSVGVWLAVGSLQIHLLQHPPGTFRSNPEIDVADVHFAFHTPDLEAFVRHAESQGFREDAAVDDPKRLLVRRGPDLAWFPQVYLLDPDRNIIEINGAP
jgi:catechol 2,3-dioxygenase-like lactoylglutathione lyase family enzyme